jgi:hypothetical protein
MYSGQGQSVPQSGHVKEYWLGIGPMMPPVWASSPDPPEGVVVRRHTSHSRGRAGRLEDVVATESHLPEISPLPKRRSETSHGGRVWE